MRRIEKRLERDRFVDPVGIRQPSRHQHDAIERAPFVVGQARPAGPSPDEAGRAHPSVRPSGHAHRPRRRRRCARGRPRAQAARGLPSRRGRQSASAGSTRRCAVSSAFCVENAITATETPQATSSAIAAICHFSRQRSRRSLRWSTRMTHHQASSRGARLTRVVLHVHDAAVRKPHHAIGNVGDNGVVRHDQRRGANLADTLTMASSTWTPLALSSDPVGSSQKSNAGRLAMARATATRCCWPPDNCAGKWIQPIVQARPGRAPRPRPSDGSRSPS